MQRTVHQYRHLTGARRSREPHSAIFAIRSSADQAKSPATPKLVDAPGLFFGFLPIGIEFNCLGDEVVAQLFKPFDQHAALARQSAALISSLDQIVRSLVHDVSVNDLPGDMHRNFSNSRLFSEWRYARTRAG